MQNGFVEIELIKPKRNNNGEIFKETVYERYKDKYQTSLHEYGNGLFADSQYLLDGIIRRGFTPLS